jgi:CHAT domain-containing protein
MITMKQAVLAAILYLPAIGQHSVEEQAAIDMNQRVQSAYAHLWLDEYEAALADAQEAHRRLEMDPEAKETPLALTVLGTRGAVHLYLGESRQALTVFEEGDALADNIVNQMQPYAAGLRSTHSQLADFYRHMAVAYFLLKMDAKALVTIQKAVGHAAASGLEGLDTFLGLDRLEALIKPQSSGLSDEDRRRALTILINAKDIGGGWLLTLGDSLTPDLVSRLIQESPDLLPLASPADRIELHAVLARQLGKLGDEKGQIEHDIAAIEIVERSRMQAGQMQALPAFFGQYVRIYDDVVAALSRKAERNEGYDSSLLRFGRSYAEAAIYFSEAAHARQFSERYGRALLEAFGKRASLPPTLLDRERELREAMAKAAASAARDLFNTSDPVAARQRAEQATKTYLDFLDSLTSQYPEFARLAFPRPVSVENLPTDLDGQFIVLYKVTDALLYWWIIINNNVVGFGTSDIGREQLTTAVARLLAYKDDKTVADPLSAAVVREPFKQIEKVSAVRPGAPPRVIIVPDEALYMLPWEALSAPRGGYVADAFITSYAPSLTALAQTASDAGPLVSDKAALVVGNTQEAAVTVPIFPARPGVFLPLGRDEMQRVILTLRSQGYNVVSVEHAHATPDYLFTLDATPYLLLHFDTHAFADTLEPPPSLILHASARSPYGLLTLAGVLKLKLHAQLVTLSACQSNLGTSGGPLPGEGVESLARMFMLAGSKSVLASLWETDAAATTALMERFYEQLDPSGFDEALALFRARAAIRRVGFTSPSQWAPFILIGQPARKLLPKSSLRK